MSVLACSERNKQEANDTRLRPTYGRSRLRTCVCMFCFHPLQSLLLFSTNQRLDEFAVVGFERLGLVSFAFVDGVALFCAALS